MVLTIYLDDPTMCAAPGDFLSKAIQQWVPGRVAQCSLSFNFDSENDPECLSHYTQKMNALAKALAANGNFAR